MGQETWECNSTVQYSPNMHKILDSKPVAKRDLDVRLGVWTKAFSEGLLLASEQE